MYIYIYIMHNILYTHVYIYIYIYIYMCIYIYMYTLFVIITFLPQVTLYIPRACNLSLYLPVVIGTVPNHRMRHEFPQPRFIPEPQYVNTAYLPDPPSYREALMDHPPIDGMYPWYVALWDMDQNM